MVIDLRLVDLESSLADPSLNQTMVEEDTQVPDRTMIETAPTVRVGGEKPRLDSGFHEIDEAARKEIEDAYFNSTLDEAGSNVDSLLIDDNGCLNAYIPR